VTLDQVDCTWIILFNDIIAFCVASGGKEKGKNPKRKIQGTMKYDVCWVTAAPDIGEDAFEIKTPETTVILRERLDLITKEVKKKERRRYWKRG